jgi:hypothetical protein
MLFATQAYKHGVNNTFSIWKCDFAMPNNPEVWLHSLHVTYMSEQPKDQSNNMESITAKKHTY